MRNNQEERFMRRDSEEGKDSLPMFGELQALCQLRSKQGCGLPN
jgi:hypothetical protein